MINNSLIDYISIRTSIAALRLITPVSIVYVPCGFLNLFRLPWIPNALLTLYTAAEATFYLFVYLPRRRRFQEPPVHRPPSLTRTQRQRIFDKCLEADNLHSSLEKKCSRPYPTGWFLPSDSSPTRRDAVDWLLWALFSTSRDAGTIDLEDVELKEELDGYIARIEKEIGRRFEEDTLHDAEEHIRRTSRMDEETGSQLRTRRRKGGMRSMRITLDPVQMLHRPLLWYFIVCLVDTYTTICFLSLGFKHYVPRTREHRACFPPRPILCFMSKYAPPGVVVPYWHRPHKSKSRHPVVFLHGIGIGLYPYISFIRKIFPADSSDNGDVGVLLPELLPISMHMTPLSVPPCAEMLRSLDLILEHLKLQDSDIMQAQEENHHEHAQNQSHDGDERRPLLRSSSSISSFSSTSSRGASLPSYVTITPSHSQRSLTLDIPSNPTSVTNNDPGQGSDTGWDRVVFTAHSYGTFVAGWIIRMCVEADTIAHKDNEVQSGVASLNTTATRKTTEPPLRLSEKIAHMVLVDPIPILLSDPTVAHNFLYREPGTVCPIMLGCVDHGDVVQAESASVNAVIEGELVGQHAHGVNVLPTFRNTAPSNINVNNSIDFLDVAPLKHTFLSGYYSSAAAWQLWYFASRDADVARTLCRAFFWAEGGVWREEVGMFVCGAGGVGASSCAGADSTTASVSDSGLSAPFRTSSAVQRSQLGNERWNGRNLAVFLGGMDQIVPADAIRRHLTREGRCTTRWSAKGTDIYTGDVGDTHGTSRAFQLTTREQEEEEVSRTLNAPDAPLQREDATNPSSSSSRNPNACVSSPLSVCRRERQGMLEVLFNPILDHAVIFDDDAYTEPLVEVVRRYSAEQ